ncbi:MAG: TaqI-like C-terminal specificity domain-containing protein [Gallionella sp.]
MKPNIKTPRNFINPLLSRKSIDEAAFAQFQAALSHYQQTLNAQVATKQSEPNIVTNALKPFFDSLGYTTQAHSQNGQSGMDLAILKDHQPTVIIEAKVPNSKDMISTSELNKKSFHEAILYFMREREKGNHALFHIIVTDFDHWFVFDAKDFDRLFWRNAAIKKIYDTHSNPTLLGSTTKEFYQLLARELPKINVDLLDQAFIDCAYFNLQQSHTPKERIAIYKLLSADNLLKAFNPNDANSLNREFYNELLYILGLEEAKEGGKKVIGKAKQAQHGTLFENISNKLTQYQKPHEFEDVIKLIIIWMNRVLFLKLLESQIVKWTTATTNQFLHPGKIKQYDQLETLFFEILAKPIAERKMHEFDAVPYLNSSLFEIHADEKMGITIATLTDDLTIDYHSKTVVKDEHRQRKTGKVSTLPYLLAFLDAYDFANNSEDEVVSDTKSLISASVLGLIFEKINGYKDGSFYTPSFITMYMARETITKAVIDKFNQAHGWQCNTLTDLHNKIDDIPAANALINRIKICDPAVGSGHFLVSALNEMLCIKSELGVLVDEHGKRIKAYRLSIENDELIIKSDDGELFEYKKASVEKTRIQKTLFNEKQIIIENCLFGVDINPNSVNICRLRLWVELLKNAYYKADGQLDTLPNIDINIKCGNSLISRFALSDDMQASNTHAEIVEYKAKVANYKQNIGSKYDLLQAIHATKNKFQQTLKTGHATTKALHRELTEYVLQFGFDDLSDELKITAFINLGLRGKTAELFAIATDKEAKAKQLNKVWAALAKKQDIENGQIYQNAFEWRFEFPEVLNEAGEFIGFDVVIGNPPYVFAREHFSIEERKYFNSHYALATYQLNLYILFLEIGTNLLKPRGGLAYITPNNWLTINSAQNVREFVLHQSHIDILNFYAKVFDDASVDTCILLYSKGDHAPKLRLYESTGANATSLVHEGNPADFMAQRDAIINIAAFRADTTQGLLNKIAAAAQPLDAVADVKVGLGAYGLGKGVPAQTATMIEKRVYHSRHKEGDDWFPYLEGRDVSRYQLAWSGEYLKHGQHLREPRSNWGLFSTPRILVRQIPSQPPYSIHACYTTEVLLNDRNSMNIINIKESPLFLLGVLNSRLMTFWFVHQFGKLQRGVFPQFKINELAQFPIAIAADTQKIAISERVAKILADKKANPQADITLLNTEIDQLVYALYQLTPAEIALIEEKSA